MMSQTEDEVFDGPGTLAIAQQLPREMALMKMENETIQTMALTRPRDYVKIRENMKAQLEAFPSFARAAIYKKPVGKDEHGKEKYARGLSVRAAEAIAEAYGYNRVRAAVELIPGDDDHVRIVGVFTDYQAGRVWEDANIVSKFYTTSRSKGAKRARMADDRFYNTVVKSEKSKQIREVILRSVTPGLRSELFEMAEAAMEALLTDTEVEKIIAQFGKITVTQEHLEKFLERKRPFWDKTDRVSLLEIWNAIKDGETTVADAFHSEAPKPEAAAGKGPVSASDLTEPQLAPGSKAPAADVTPSQPPSSVAQTNSGSDTEAGCTDAAGDGGSTGAAETAPPVEQARASDAPGSEQAASSDQLYDRAKLDALKIELQNASGMLCKSLLNHYIGPETPLKTIQGIELAKLAIGARMDAIYPPTKPADQPKPSGGTQKDLLG